MTAQDDLCTPQLSASPDPQEPGTMATAFLPIGRIVHNRTKTLHLASREGYRARTMRLCRRGDHSWQRINRLQRISGSSSRFFIGYCHQYWGRRRYGPARQDCRMA